MNKIKAVLKIYQSNLPNKSYAIVGISDLESLLLFNLLMGGNLSYQGDMVLR